MGASPITTESVNSTTTVLMSSDINRDLATWNNEFQQDFSIPVSHIDIMSPFKLSFLQMKRLPLDECLDLYDPAAPKWEPAKKVKGKTEVQAEPEIKEEVVEPEVDPVLAPEDEPSLEVTETPVVAEEISSVEEEGQTAEEEIPSQPEAEVTTEPVVEDVPAEETESDIIDEQEASADESSESDENTTE